MCHLPDGSHRLGVCLIVKFSWQGLIQIVSVLTWVHDKRARANDNAEGPAISLAQKDDDFYMANFAIYI